MPRTLFDKLWDSHVVADLGEGRTLVHIDRHMLHDVTSPQAFAGLAEAKRKVRNPELTFSVNDHIVSTDPGRGDGTEPGGKEMIQALRANAATHGITHFDIGDIRQGIVHVIAPELGIAQPGMTLVCGDSHTCTIGALGAWAWGIGTSDVEHVLATQTLIIRRPKTMRVTFHGRLQPGVSAKDMILFLIGRIGTGGATGYAVEYAGAAVTALDMDGRFTLCNMAIEAGARAGIIAPDETTFAYVTGRAYSPKGEALDQAIAAWRLLPSDADARYDRDIEFDASAIAPQITWGTSPEQVIDIGGRVPDPDQASDLNARRAMAQALDYMGLTPGMKLEGLPIDMAFIGSCTNSRIEDLRAAAAVMRGRKVAQGVRVLVVAGSGQIKQTAEAEGLDRIFRDAGFEWREPGCSMCLAMNDDRLEPGERCASTSNRNFEGRQGAGGRTHLVSPAMAAAAAVAGHFVDVRRLY